MSRALTNLVGAKYGPFEVTEDKRLHFYDPVTVRTTCCNRVITKKTVIALNTVRWRKGKQCARCAQQTWSGLSGAEHALLQRARKHGLVKQWKGAAGARLMLDHLGPAPSKDHVLGTINPSKPHGPDNSVWMTQSELLIAHKRAVSVPTPNGPTTIPIMARRLKLSRQAIHQRQERGYTLEEATTTPKGTVPERLIKLRANKKKS